MARTRDPRKEEPVEVAPKVPVKEDGASTVKKRSKPRKNPVNSTPKMIKDTIEPAQPVASTSQLPIIKIPSEKSKRILKTKDPLPANLWTQGPVDLQHVPQPVASTSALQMRKGSAKGKERMRQEDVDAMMLSTSGNDVMEIANTEAEDHPLPFLLADDGSTPRAKGKKRSREDRDPTEAKPPKRVKIASTSAEKTKTPTVKKAKAASTGKAGKRSTLVQSVKWKVVEGTQSTTPASTEVTCMKETNFRPRIWTNNREELLAMMPEMLNSKWCFNGISWAMYETPMLLLDEINTCFQVERDDQDVLSLDLITTRSFVCPIPQESDFQKSSTIEVPLPPRPFEGPASPREQLPGVKPRPRPRYKPKHKSPTTKKEMPNIQAMGASTSDTHQNGVETMFRREALPTITFNFKQPGPAESLPDYSSLDNGFEVASGSSTAGLVEPPISHTMKFEAGPIHLYPVYQVEHSPPSSPGWGPSHGADRDIPATYSMTGNHSMHNNLAQAEWMPVQRQPFRSRFPSPDERESYVLRSVDDDEDMEFLYPPPEDEPPHPLHDFLPTPGQSVPTSGGAQVPFVGHHSADTGPSSQHASVMIGEDSDFMQLVYPGESVANLVAPSHRAGHNAPTPMTLASEFSTGTALAQVERLPSYRRPFQPIPVIPSAIDGEYYTLGSVQRENMRFLPPPPLTEDGRSSVHAHGFAPLPENLTATSATEAPVGEHSIGAGSTSQHVSVMIGENSDVMQLVDAQAEESLANLTAKADSRLQDYVPLPIPEELDSLIDSYLFGRPLTILISNGLLKKHWSLKLPREYGYAMLGYFQILGVQETRVHAEGETNKSTNKAPSQDSLSGKVRWKFRLQWAPGGEKSILAEGNTYDLQHPWWVLPSPVQEPPSEESSVGKIPKEVDDPEASFPTTARYRDARIRHPEYKFRHFPLDDLYQSVIPLNLLIPFGREYMDTSFPRGWFCKDCGRMNFQAALRHRQCLSSFCRNKPPSVASYAQILFLLRDPQERLPLFVPLNQYPEELATTAIAHFPDGMQTFSYHLSKDPNVVMKHIFTSNMPLLQEPASILLNDIQINVPIVRSLTDNTPYFLWSAKSPKDNTAPTDTEWKNIHATMNQAKDLIVRTVRSFGGLKEEQVAVNNLRMLAWITSGQSKRLSDLIQAKNKSVIFFALGCTVGLVITPRSMGGTITVDKSQEAESSKLPKNDIVDQDDAASGWIAEDHEDGEEESIEIPKKGKAIAKSTKPSFVITLMHGDMIVFYGNEFEYSVKRDGTSLLLIASHDSLEHA